jgi:hypothetical protein
MDLSALQLEPTPKHAGGPTSHRAFPVVLIVTFLALSACAAFAVVMTNGPDGRAAADVMGVSDGSLDVSTGDTVDLTAPVDGTVVRSLDFRASLPSGPLVLGEPGSLVITVVNPSGSAIAVQSVEVSVLPPSEEGCLAEWLTVGGYTAATDPPLLVAANGTVRLVVPYMLVDLATTNQDACKGASFPLSITGTGRAV